MESNFNLDNHKITNVKKASHNIEQLNEGISTLALQNSKLLSTNNFDTGNNKIVNLEKRTQPTDAVTPEQLGESHITQHVNRVNVLKYIMQDDAEREADFRTTIDDIQKAAFLPHQINKKVYRIGFIRKQDNTYYSRFGFNLFKLI